MVRALSCFYSLEEPCPVATPLMWLPLALRERPSDYALPGRDSQALTREDATPPIPDLVDLYFEDAFRRTDPELLTHREEIELSQAIEKGRLAALELEAQPHQAARSDALRQQICRGDKARHRLIEANLRLVVSVASWYRSAALPLPDLIQEGNIGLMQAVEKYDWRRGTRFSTCAVWWIRQAIARSLANDSRLIRVPVHIHQQLGRIARTKRTLYQRFGREASSCELAEALGLPQEQVEDLLPHMHAPGPLDTFSQSENGGGPYPVETSGDGQVPSTEEQACQRISCGALYRAIEELSLQEQRFLERRFGLRCREPRSLRATGETLGITKGKAQTLEARALGKLRRDL